MKGTCVSHAFIGFLRVLADSQLRFPRMSMGNTVYRGVPGLGLCNSGTQLGWDSQVAKHSPHTAVPISLQQLPALERCCSQTAREQALRATWRW